MIQWCKVTRYGVLSAVQNTHANIPTLNTKQKTSPKDAKKGNAAITAAFPVSRQKIYS